MSFPSTDLEVEIVLPILLLENLIVCFRRTCIRLSEPRNWLQDNNQATRQKTSPNLFKHAHHCLTCFVSPDPSFILLNVIIQFVSHILPPSSEKACSKRDEFGAMSEKPFRT